MGNDYDANEYPLAYLITFRTYGTWLHGDPRGSMDRGDHNIYGTPRIPLNARLETSDATQLTHPPVTLGAAQRSCVELAIREVCEHRHYVLMALNIRTNHVHAVVSAAVKPDKVMNAFKAYATRKLRETGNLSGDVTLWTRRGSKRWLWKPRDVELALDYVNNGQGDDLPRFD